MCVWARVCVCVCAGAGRADGRKYVRPLRLVLHHTPPEGNRTQPAVDGMVKRMKLAFKTHGDIVGSKVAWRAVCTAVLLTSAALGITHSQNIDAGMCIVVALAVVVSPIGSANLSHTDRGQPCVANNRRHGEESEALVRDTRRHRR